MTMPNQVQLVRHAVASLVVCGLIASLASSFAAALGINYLPINGGSLYLGRDADYVKHNFENMLASNRNFHTGGFEGDPARIDRWHDVLHEYLALADPAESMKRFEEQFPSEFGETRATRNRKRVWKRR